MRARRWPIWCVSRLTEAGIDAFIVNESLQQGANELLPSVIGPRVAVAVDDAARAHAIVAEFQAEGAARVPEDIDLHDLEGHGIRATNTAARITINVSTAKCLTVPPCANDRLSVLSHGERGVSRRGPYRDRSRG